MAANIGQGPAARWIMTEGIGRARITHIILGMYAAIAANVTQFSARNHLAGQRHDRVAQVIEPNLGFDPCRLCRNGHLLCVTRQGGQGLFAIDMLARRNRGHGHFFVQRIWRGDIDHIYIGVFD